jgi:hypothetical protein
MDVDWSSIEELCRTHSIALEKNDAMDRPAFDCIGPVVHKDNCWLGKNYANEPDKWGKGCDLGCVKEAAQKLKHGGQSK